MSNYSLKRLGSKLFNAFTIDGGDNYLELNFIHQDTNQHYSVTVKPTGKITQGQKNILLTKRITEFEKENASLDAQNKRVCSEIAELEKDFNSVCVGILNNRGKVVTESTLIHIRGAIDKFNLPLDIKTLKEQVK